MLRRAAQASVGGLVGLGAGVNYGDVKSPRNLVIPAVVGAGLGAGLGASGVSGDSNLNTIGGIGGGMVGAYGGLHAMAELSKRKLLTGPLPAAGVVTAGTALGALGGNRLANRLRARNEE